MVTQSTREEAEKFGRVQNAKGKGEVKEEK